jgi:hypothetical protein
VADRGPLALVNGRIVTGDRRRPRADAVLLAATQVVLVGSSAEVRKLGGPHVTVCDLAGAAVTSAEGATISRGGEVTLLVHASADPRSAVVWRWPQDDVSTLLAPRGVGRPETEEIS